MGMWWRGVWGIVAIAVGCGSNNRVIPGAAGTGGAGADAGATAGRAMGGRASPSGGRGAQAGSAQAGEPPVGTGGTAAGDFGGAGGDAGDPTGVAGLGGFDGTAGEAPAAVLGWGDLPEEAPSVVVSTNEGCVRFDPGDVEPHPVSRYCFRRLSPDHRWVVDGLDNELTSRLVETATGESRELPSSSGYLFPSFSPSSETVATKGFVVDVRDRWSPVAHPSGRLVWSASGSHLLVYESELTLIKTSDGAVTALGSFPGVTDWLPSHDGTYLAGDGAEPRVIRADGTLVDTSEGLNPILWLPGKSELVVSTAEGLAIYSADTGNLRSLPEGLKSVVSSSPDGNWLLANDGTYSPLHIASTVNDTTYQIRTGEYYRDSAQWSPDSALLLHLNPGRLLAPTTGVLRRLPDQESSIDAWVGSWLSPARALVFPGWLAEGVGSDSPAFRQHGGLILDGQSGALTPVSGVAALDGLWTALADSAAGGRALCYDTADRAYDDGEDIVFENRRLWYLWRSSSSPSSEEYRVYSFPVAASRDCAFLP
jgi:hypothetical protein